MDVAGSKAGLSICYESAFPEEMSKALPEAEFLIMASNDAMFDDTIELPQHHNVARMRALESGRWVVRVTQTGISAVIDSQAQTIASLPVKQFGVLHSVVQPRIGITPYIRWGNCPLIIWVMLVIVFFLYQGKKPIESFDNQKH